MSPGTDGACLRWPLHPHLCFLCSRCLHNWLPGVPTSPRPTHIILGCPVTKLTFLIALHYLLSLVHLWLKFYGAIYTQLKIRPVIPRSFSFTGSWGSGRGGLGFHEGKVQRQESTAGLCDSSWSGSCTWLLLPREV